MLRDRCCRPPESDSITCPRLLIDRMVKFFHKSQGAGTHIFIFNQSMGLFSLILFKK